MPFVPYPFCGLSMPYYGKRRRGKKPYMRRTRRRIGKYKGRKKVGVIRQTHDRMSSSVGRQSVVLYRGPSYLPATFLTQHVYRQFFQADSTSVAISYNQYAINDMFQVVIGETGNQQPMGYDEMRNIYNRSNVNAAKIKLSFHSQETTGPYMLCLVPLATDEVFNTTPDAVSLDSIMQQPNALTQVLGETTSNTSDKIFEQYVSMKKLIGRNVFDTSYGAVSGASTSKPARWNLVVANMEGTNSLHYNLLVEITFYVKWWERKVLVDSTT